MATAQPRTTLSSEISKDERDAAEQVGMPTGILPQPADSAGRGDVTGAVGFAADLS
ncbi:hypothetical protein HUE56_07445 (plasmid) [Azospirillum oryzae]|uniref:Uncharacterized protein n=1 Tax=Azospirillum oryzae TaxID=286727 RepID=A0A6N1AMU7_9PROT|nr:hypothetical protein [Azospirillum oryzae]QKS50374.1 hypothetical protein HUE56_07445 [Azospirillum oryzae]